VPLGLGEGISPGTVGISGEPQAATNKTTMTKAPQNILFTFLRTSLFVHILPHPVGMSNVNRDNHNDYPDGLATGNVIILACVELRLWQTT